MTICSSILAWRIPWTEEPCRLHSIGSHVLAWRIPGSGEPCGLLSMGSHRVGHDWSVPMHWQAGSLPRRAGRVRCRLWPARSGTPQSAMFAGVQSVSSQHLEHPSQWGRVHSICQQIWKTQSRRTGSLRYSNSLEALRELETVRIKLVKWVLGVALLATSDLAL